MVQICERENETFAVANINIRNILQIDGNRLIGAVGQAVDKQLVRFDKRR